MRKKEDAKEKDAIKKRRYKGHPPFASASLHKLLGIQTVSLLNIKHL